MEARDAYVAAFESARASLPGVAALRRAAIEGLEFPMRRNEAWRFTSARQLLAEVRPCAYGVFGALPEGVQGVEALGSVAGTRLGSVASSDGFAGLNAAFFKDFALLATEAGASRTVELSTQLGGLATPRVLVVGESGSHTEVLLHHALRPGLAVPVVEIVALAGARVSLTHVVEGEGDLAGCIAVEAGEGSEVAVQSVLAGVGIARLDLTARLGPSSRLDTSGLVLGAGSAHADHHLCIHHSGAGATSTQRFRNILDARSRAVFTGEVHVLRDVPGADATQTANTLLLSDDASAVARPWLVIDNDDVAASHGATVGRLDPDALFYLRSRGVGALEARRLLTRAFAGEVIETVPAAFREGVEHVVERYLAGRVS
ncbi:MAG: SufD family Fe-S cluster assembly protein [Alphaproteobacteria bacterium]|nr:SufD family Fe-S cluster assembly protein [Alphaproteobacteria bacterium]